jgi:transcriptional regulator with XRE-family HTH domain
MALLIAEPLTDAMPEGVTISASVSNNYTAFGKCLMDAILRNGISQRSFAERVGAVGPHVSQIVNGLRTPPLDRVAVWADALGITGQERQRFLDLAAIAHLPAEAQPRFLLIHEEYHQLLELRDQLLAEEGKPIPPRA